MNDFILTFSARSIQGISNLSFIIISTLIIPIEEFSKFVPYTICLGLVVPFLNNGSSDYFQKFEVRKNTHFTLFVIIFLVITSVSIFLIIAVSLLYDVNAFLTLIFLLLFILFESLSRLYSDFKLKDNDVKFLEKTILFSAIVTVFFSFLLLFILKSWLVLALKPIIFSALKYGILRFHKNYNLNFETSQWKSIIFEYLGKIKQLFFFNILSTFVENIDKLVFNFYDSDAVIGNVERLSTFSRLSDSTFRTPFYRLMISLNMSKQKWKKYTNFVFIPTLTIFCFFMLSIAYFKYPKVNILLLLGYLFFGVGWFLRGIFFSETLYFFESGKLSLKAMKMYIIIIALIYITCSYSKLNFESIQFVIGVFTISFWTICLVFLEKINSFNDN